MSPPEWLAQVGHTPEPCSVHAGVAASIRRSGRFDKSTGALQHANSIQSTMQAGESTASFNP
jgi:hypothetical protein